MTVDTAEIVDQQQIALYTELAVRWGVSLGTALLIFAIGWLVSKWTHRLVLRTVQLRALDPAIGRFLASIARWAMLGATGIVALGQVGVQTTSLVAMFASAGIAIGLALQGSLSNFASGVLLLVFRPFTLDDWITAGGQTGRVEEIGLFATVLVTADNQRVVVPNSAITATTIVNVTAPGTRRVEIDVQVGYGADVDAVIQLLDGAVRSCPSVLQEPQPSVLLTELGPTTIVFRAYGWGKSADHAQLGHQMRAACYRAVGRAGLGPPLPAAARPSAG